MIPRLLKHALCVGAILHITGCVPEFDSPIRASTGPSYDDRLSGLWKWENVDGDTYCHIAPSKDGGTVVVVAKDNQTGLSSTQFSFLAACYERCYLSLRYGKKETDGYVLLEYKFNSAGGLRLRNANSDVIRQKLKSGQIEGEINTTSLYPSERIHSPEQQIRQFFSENAEAVFTGDPIDLKRAD